MIHPVKSVKRHIRRNRKKYVFVATTQVVGLAYVAYCGIGWKQLLEDPEAFNAKHPA